MISPAIIHIIINAYAYIFGMMFLLWLLHLAIKNAGVVDLGWGMGFIIVALIYFIKIHGLNLREALCLMMVGLWGFRITFFLIKRFLTDKHEDRRYTKMRNEWGGNLALKFFFFYEFQSILIIIISLPFFLIAQNPVDRISFWEIAGAFIFIISFIAEAIADEQLYGFKNDPANKGKVCNIGLWRYSRHPNYFFEWMIWVSFFVYTLGSPHGWLAIISPIIMYVLLIYVSGVPMAEEQSLKSRGEAYIKYRQQTNMFFPGPRKSGGVA